MHETETEKAWQIRIKKAISVSAYNDDLKRAENNCGPHSRIFLIVEPFSSEMRPLYGSEFQTSGI